MVKQPKLYFYDTGLACSLLGLETAGQLETHYGRGALFENAVILEKMKRNYNAGRLPRQFFWRDHRGREVDCIEESAEGIHATEIKSGVTITESHMRNLRWFAKTASPSLVSSSLVYAGTRAGGRGEVELIPWQSV